MSDPQSKSFGLRVAAARQREFTSLYGLVLIAETIFGLLVLIAPRLAARSFGLPDGLGYRLWGAMLLFGVLLQLPGLASPIHARLTIISGVIGRVMLVFVYVLLSLWLPAVVTLVATVSLSALFTRLIYAEIGSRP